MELKAGRYRWKGRCVTVDAAGRMTVDPPVGVRVPDGMAAKLRSLAPLPDGMADALGARRVAETIPGRFTR